MEILRTTPKYFDVVYVINPYMEAGLGNVNKEKAQAEWDNLSRIYDELGVEYGLIEGQPNLPDMVFTANAVLPFRRANGAKAVIISNMEKDERKPESPFYEAWFKEQGYEIEKLPERLSFSGTGDALYHYDRSFIWAGYGFRTSTETHQEIAKITGLEVKSLRLMDPWFYDLDTCLTPLNESTALVYFKAFDEASQDLIRAAFTDPIELTPEEARNFTCNSHLLKDGKHIIMNGKSPRIEEELKKRGFTVVTAPTEEFLKAGGSVACMKMVLV